VKKIINESTSRSSQQASWCVISLVALVIRASSENLWFRPSKGRYWPKIAPLFEGVSLQVNQLPWPDPLFTSYLL
jgi:hypothetical protein